MMESKKLSIIIPTYNEEECIRKCIESLLDQSYKNYEIIVVDDGSTDKTREIIRKFKNIMLIKGLHKGPGFSRNLGVKNSKGDILIFVDADMEFPKDYLKNIIDPILTKDALGAEEKYQLATNLENRWAKCWGKYVTPSNKKIRKIFRSIKKKDFLEMGGFDSKYGYADDQTFFLKYGVKAEVAEKAYCYHKNPENLKDVYKQSRWIGSSINNFFLKVPLFNYLSLFLLYLLSPLGIIFISIKKSYQNKNFKNFFPWMVIFMTVRYFGTISGIRRKIYLNNNIR